MLQLTGDLTWAESHIAMVKESCRTELNRNIALWEKSNPTATPTLPVGVVNTLCLNDCSGKGDCREGEKSGRQM